MYYRDPDSSLVFKKDFVFVSAQGRFLMNILVYLYHEMY